MTKKKLHLQHFLLNSFRIFSSIANRIQEYLHHKRVAQNLCDTKGQENMRIRGMSLSWIKILFYEKHNVI